MSYLPFGYVVQVMRFHLYNFVENNSHLTYFSRDSKFVYLSCCIKYYIIQLTTVTLRT